MKPIQKMRVLALVAGLLMAGVSDTIAQESTKKNQRVMEIAEKMPSFPGGEKGLMEWLKDNVKYPDAAAKDGIEGRVIVSFVVDADGSVCQPSVLKSVDPLLDNEALRVVNAMPKWTPGESGGKPVAVRFTLPVSFKKPSASEATERTSTKEN